MSRFGPPPALTPLLGRAEEQGRLATALTGESRLTVLTGPPGIGKTRLAVEAGRSLAEGTSVWVDASTIQGPEDLCACLADALGLRLSWVDLGDYVDELGYALEGRGPVLVILDEAEGALDALSAVLPRWLDAAPAARVLVTSRERLGVTGEVLVEVGPLATEGDDAAAVLLVLQHAGARLPDEPAERAALQRLVQALDGVPLALELVASRLRVLSAVEILERFAAKGLSAIEAKHGRGSPLYEALADSWDRLEPPAQEALARCAVFAGAFDTAAAEAVLGPEAVDLLHLLRDRSLLARSERQHRLYAPVRAFAAERLAAEVAADASRSHAAYYAEFARRHREALAGPRRAAALRALTDALDELRGAWEAADPGQRRELALATTEVLVERGPAEAAWAQLDALPPDPEVRMARAKVHEVTGRMEAAIADLEAATAALEVPAERARGLVQLAACELARGAVDASVQLADHALELAPEGSAVRVEALRQRAIGAHARGSLDVAAEHYERARRLADDLGLSQRAAQLRADIGTVRLQEGRHDEAREHYQAAVEALDPRFAPVALGLAEGNLAILEQEQGALERAAELLARGMGRLRSVGHRLYVAHLGVYAGAVEHERGDLALAITFYEQALDGLRRVGDSRTTAVVAALRGAAEAERGREAAARAAFEEAAGALERIDDPGIHRAVALHRVHLELLDPAARDAAVAAVAEAAADEVVARSDDARIAMRLLDRRLGRGALTFAVDARTLTLPDGSEVDLSTRTALWNIALALGEAHGEGAALDSMALLEAGWPGETISAESGLNRVKVALSTLRKLGLREVLLRSDEGYRFDPEIPVTLAPD